MESLDLDSLAASWAKCLLSLNHPNPRRQTAYEILFCSRTELQTPSAYRLMAVQDEQVWSVNDPVDIHVDHEVARAVWFVINVLT